MTWKLKLIARRVEYRRVLDRVRMHTIPVPAMTVKVQPCSGTVIRVARVAQEAIKMFAGFVPGR